MIKSRRDSIGSLIALVLASLVASTSTGAEKDSLPGRYWFPEKDGQFEIEEREGRYFGRVVSYHVPDQLDERNADPALRGRRFVGIDMLSGFRFDESEGGWTEGTIYDGNNGKTYDCNLWFEPGDPNTLKARGYIGFSFLGRTESFERVVDAP